MAAPVYADHPFPLITTPAHLKAKDPNGGEPDLFDIIASDMALVHNLIGRGLNSIYLQAPYITAADEKHFLKYMHWWHTMVHIHHNNEETHFFPLVEKMAGADGIMSGNIEQHHAFHPGLDKFKAFVEEGLAGKRKYDGKEVVAIIDEFGTVLMQHLTDEIQTLLGLRVYGEEKMRPVIPLMEEEAEKGMKALGLPGVVWAFTNIDKHYEGGLWASWPPAPAPVKFLVPNLFLRVYSNLSKFGAVDSRGRMRPLYAVPK